MSTNTAHTAVPTAKVGPFLCAPFAAATARAVRRAALAPAAGFRQSAGRVRSVLHAVACLPLAVVTLGLTGYGWFIMTLSALYPLRPLVGVPGYTPDSWGGPSYAGVWATHAVLAFLFLWAVTWVVRGLARVQARISRGVLGTGPSA